jgi:YD repeat-containing protein
VESAEDSLARVTDGDHAPLTFSRDGLGREVRRESGAGFKLDQAYDRVGQLLKQSAGIAIKPGIAGAAAAQKAG